MPQDNLYVFILPFPHPMIKYYGKCGVLGKVPGTQKAPEHVPIPTAAV